MNAITFTLPGFTQLNQNSTPPLDGFPDPNHSWECVPTSIADGLRFKLGRTHGLKPDGTPDGVFFDGDSLRDNVYGENYRGGQAASSYVAYCLTQGVLLSPFNGNPTQLVAQIHASVSQGNPVIATIPSQWGLGRDGARAYAAEHDQPYTTHVICFCGQGSGSLRASNPWIAPLWHDGDDQYWINDLEDNQIWVMLMAHEVHMSIPNGWHDDGTTLTAPNGHHVLTAKRNYIMNTAWDSANVPLNESYGIANGTRQDFLECALVWTGSAVTVAYYGNEVMSLRAQVQQAGHPAPTVNSAPLKALGTTAVAAVAALENAVNALP